MEDLLDQLEQAYQRGELARVLYITEQALANPAFAAKRAYLLFYAGAARTRISREYNGEALSYLREALAAAGRNKGLKARIMGALGKIYGDSGDYAAFDKLMPHYEKLGPATHREARRWGVFVWYNYGVTLEGCFRWQDAVAAYSKAAQWAAEFKNLILEGWSLHNLAGVYICMGALQTAQETIAKVDTLPLPDAEFGAKKLSRRAEYALATGDHVSAQQFITTALLHPAADDRTRADVYHTWARLLLELGRPSDAKEKGMTALDYAFKSTHTSGIHLLNRFLQQLER